MIRINLLPPEIVEERQRKAVRARNFKGTVFVLVLLMAGFGGLMTLTLQTRSQLYALKERHTEVNTEIKTYAPVVGLQGEVNNRTGLVQSAMGPQLAWREALSLVGSHIPENVWLTNFSLAMGEDGHGEMVMRGLTYDHPSTARWISTLEDVQGFTDIRASFSAEETVDESELVRFEVRVSVTAEEEYDPLSRGE
ncbi:MAG: PilN domain-containing protein [Bacillota bacterium]|nr:PilN domain-containing protein [Bacillota bacterium]